MDQNKINLLIEAEKRGILPDDKRALLYEAAKRGLIPQLNQNDLIPSSQKENISLLVKNGDQKSFNDKYIDFVKNLRLPLVGTVLGPPAGAALLGLPTGGLGTPLGAVALSGAGGAAGKALEQALLAIGGYNTASTPGRTLKEQALNIGENFYNVGKAGLEGAATQMAGESIGPLLKGTGNFLNRNIYNISQRLATSSFPQAPTEVAEALLKGEKTLGQEAASRGIYGFKRNVLNILNTNKKNIGSELDSTLKFASDKNINPQDVVKELEPVKKRFLELGNFDAVKTIEKKSSDWLSQFSNPANTSINKFLTPSEANLLKRQFANQAKQAFKQSDFTETAGVTAEFSQAMAKGIRKQIEKIVPESSFLNKEYHIYDKLSESLANSLARDLLKSSPSLSNQIGVMESAAIGKMITGENSGGLKAGAGFLASKSFPVKTFLASKLSQFAKNPTEEVALQVLENPVFKKAILNGVLNEKLTNLKK